MLDLRQFANWCHERHVTLSGAWRADIECFARDLERGVWGRPVKVPGVGALRAAAPATPVYSVSLRLGRQLRRRRALQRCLR